MSEEGILAPPLSPSVNPANTGQISHDEINKTVQGELTKKETRLIESLYGGSSALSWLMVLFCHTKSCKLEVGILLHHWTWA